MDDYKVKQLRKMLAHETDDGEHYGARLSHWYGDTNTLTIDAGGLEALIRYYEEHDTNLEGTMNRYAEMRKRQQEEVNALPLGFAFSQKQFEEMMKGWGLRPKGDIDKICRIPAGGFVQKKDLPLIRNTFARHHQELDDAIKADETGDGFIYEMFMHEMYNHEYGYTGDPEETLDALGFTYEQVTNNKLLARGFNKAHKEVMGRA